MKLVEAVIIIIAVLAVSAAGIWHFWGRDLAATANIGAGLAAKHVCSCVHVDERPMESCLDDFVQDIDQLNITTDGNVTTAKAPMGLASASARYEPGLGCTFVAP